MKCNIGEEIDNSYRAMVCPYEAKEGEQQAIEYIQHIRERREEDECIERYQFATRSACQVIRA